MKALRVPGRSELVCALLACVVGACDQEVTVDGMVRSADGRPVVRATVELNCPGKQSPTEPALTNDAGAFELSRFVGCASVDCNVVVRKPSGERVEFPVRDHCRGRRFGCGQRWCNDIRVEAKF